MLQMRKAKNLFNILKKFFSSLDISHNSTALDSGRSERKFIVNICSLLCAYCFRFYENSKEIRQRIKD